MTGLTALLFSGVIAMGAEPRDSSAVELAKLQGVWLFESLELEGQELSKEMLTGSSITVEGDTFKTVSMQAVYSGKVAVDGAKNPKTIDLMFTDGPEKGNTSLGVYKVVGDLWTICLGLTGADRPKAFESKPGSNHALETLRRAGEADGS